MNYLIVKTSKYDETEIYDAHGDDFKDAISKALKENINYFGWSPEDCPDINDEIVSDYDFDKYADFIYESIVWNGDILVFKSEYPISNGKI